MLLWFGSAGNSRPDLSGPTGGGSLMCGGGPRRSVPRRPGVGRRARLTSVGATAGGGPAGGGPGACSRRCGCTPDRGRRPGWRSHPVPARGRGSALGPRLRYGPSRSRFEDVGIGEPGPIRPVRVSAAPLGRRMRRAESRHQPVSVFALVVTIGDPEAAAVDATALLWLCWCPVRVPAGAGEQSDTAARRSRR